MSNTNMNHEHTSGHGGSPDLPTRKGATVASQATAAERWRVVLEELTRGGECDATAIALVLDLMFHDGPLGAVVTAYGLAELAQRYADAGVPLCATFAAKRSRALAFAHNHTRALPEGTPCPVAIASAMLRAAGPYFNGRPAVTWPARMADLTDGGEPARVRGEWAQILAAECDAVQLEAMEVEVLPTTNAA